MTDSAIGARMFIRHKYQYPEHTVLDDGTDQNKLLHCQKIIGCDGSSKTIVVL